MNEMILKMEAFKQQIAYSLNNSELPAEIMRYILRDFDAILLQLSQQQLAQAQNPEPKEDDNDGNAKN